MAFVLNDRVFETTITTGTGSINLGGEPDSFQSFVDGVGDGNTTFYLINNDTDWEVGIGTVTAGAPDTLSRDTVYQSSNSDAKVNFGSGTKNVRLSLISEFLVTENKDNTFSASNTFNGLSSFIGKVAYPDSGELTIASGVITVTGSNHTIDTESDAATDDLVTINGGADGQVVFLSIENSSRNVVIKTTGNILTFNGQDLTLNSTSNCVRMIYSAALSKWQVESTGLVLLDEDDMVSDSPTAAPSQQSVKAYVDNNDRVAKAWVRFNGTSTPTIVDSFNVDSITDNGTGDYTINFSTAMNNANFSVVGMSDNLTSATNGSDVYWRSSDVNSVRIQTRGSGNGALIDPSFVSVIVFGS